MFLAWQHERDGLVMRVEQKEERLIANRLAFEAQDIARVAAEKHSQTAHKRRSPFRIAHLVTTGIEPHHVLYLGAANSSALQKLRSAKDRMILTQFDQPPGEFDQSVLFFIPLPVEPADVIVLAIRVVVPFLGSAEFISA